MQQTKLTNKKSVIICAVILVILIAVFGTVYFIFRPKTSGGEKAITIEVVYGATTVYHINTDAEYLRQALEETDGLSIVGEESEYGLYIKTINGVTADFESDGAYWSLYTNGEYATNGIESEPVHDKDVFSLKYETANDE